MKILDEHGNEQGAEWLEENFGDVRFTPHPTGYQVSELRDTGYNAPAVMIVTVKKDGVPQPNVKVMQTWQDGPMQANGHRGMIGVTGGDGKTGFGWGHGEYYFPPAGGPHDYFVDEEEGSEVIHNIGMLGETNHQHLNIEFDLSTGSMPQPVPPPVVVPPPSDTNWVALLKKLDRIIELLEGKNE